MELNDIVIQIIGFIGFGLIGLSYLAKQKKRILLWSIIGGMIVAIHLYFLNGITGALCNIIGGIELVIIYFYDKSGRKNRWPLILLTILISAIIAWLSWAGPQSLLPIFAMTIIMAAFISPEEKYIRYANLIGSTLWLVYDVLVGSISGIICEFFILSMTAIAVWKYRNIAKKRAKKPVIAHKNTKNKVERGKYGQRS